MFPALASTLCEHLHKDMQPNGEIFVDVTTLGCVLGGRGVLGLGSWTNRVKTGWERIYLSIDDQRKNYHHRKVPYQTFDDHIYLTRRSEQR